MNPTTTLPAYVQTALDRHEQQRDEYWQRAWLHRNPRSLNDRQVAVISYQASQRHARAAHRIREEWMVS